MSHPLWKYNADRNRLYRFDLSNIPEIPVSYQPRLAPGDIVVIVDRDKGYPWHRKRQIPCYCVTVIKPLSKLIRCTLERNTVGKVPEDCLIPYEASPFDLPFTPPVSSHKAKMIRLGKTEEKEYPVDYFSGKTEKIVHRLKKNTEKCPLEVVQLPKYSGNCKYCGVDQIYNSAGAVIGAHECIPARDQLRKFKIDELIDNRQHDYLIHGFLLAVRKFVSEFRLQSMATYIFSRSGILKKDLIRCQLESEDDSDIILPLIEAAFPEPPKKQKNAVELQSPGAPWNQVC